TTTGRATCCHSGLHNNPATCTKTPQKTGVLVQSPPSKSANLADLARRRKSCDLKIFRRRRSRSAKSATQHDSGATRQKETRPPTNGLGPSCQRRVNSCRGAAPPPSSRGRVRRAGGSGRGWIDPCSRRLRGRRRG